MEAKPFTIQSPKDVAEQYGGNKQKIAAAIKLGVVDSTAGVLAGMFIDRMRAAAQAEQVPQQTIAQKVLAPPAPPMPPQGLGAIAPPGMGMPPQGMPMPPQGGMPPQMAMQDAMPPQGGMPPQGMAMGGMYDPPYTQGGGLSDLPLPAGMFDEPDNGSYAGGGIVAFDQGGGVAAPPYQPDNTDPAYLQQLLLSGLPASIAALKANTPRTTTDTDAFRAYLDETQNPEALAKQKRQDLGSFLAELGFGMAASKSPNFLQAVGESAAAATPGLMKTVEQRKAEHVEALKQKMIMEGATNREAEAYAAQALALGQGAQQIARSVEDRKSREGIAARSDSTQLEGARISGDYAVRAAGARGNSETAAALKAAEGANALAIANELKERLRPDAGTETSRAYNTALINANKYAPNTPEWNAFMTKADQIKTGAYNALLKDMGVATSALGYGEVKGGGGNKPTRMWGE